MKLSILNSGYDLVKYNRRSTICLKRFNLKDDLILLFKDIFSLIDEDCFKIDRSILVEKSVMDDIAFNSSFSLLTSSFININEKDLENLLWFAPGAWYKKNKYSESRIDLKNRFEFFREDRLSAPLLMLFLPNLNLSLTVARGNIDASSVQRDSRKRVLIDGRIKVGSFGATYSDNKVLLGWWYPAIEGMWRYTDNPSNTFLLDLHPLNKNFSQKYALIIRLKDHRSFIDAVLDTWRFFYNYYNPRHVNDVNLDEIERCSINLLYNLCRDFGNGVIGIPLYICPRTGYVWNRNLEVGHTGRQLLSAYYLIRFGLNENRTDMLEKGEKMIDFWVKKSGFKLSHVSYNPDTQCWYDDNLYPGGGSSPPNKVFLRKEVEAHLAVLLAIQEEIKNGRERPEWEAWVTSFGDWLIENQNSDGSFYRQYYVDGTPSWYEKGNTYEVVPFLIELYRSTNERKYLESAIKAGDFHWDSYGKEFEFFGATLENTNVYDKEAGLHSFEAYLSLYEVSGDEKWLKAAETAALFAETWIYIWNVPMPIDDPKVEWDVSKTTVGTGLIAVDHSNVDMYQSFNAYEYFRLYQITKDTHYLDIAKILLNNTKQMIDLNGKLNFAELGFQQEGWCFSIDRRLKRGYGVSVWLPWVSVSHLHGILKIRDSYGTTDLDLIADFPRRITPGIIGNIIGASLFIKSYKPTINIRVPREIKKIFLDCPPFSEVFLQTKTTNINKIRDNGSAVQFEKKEKTIYFRVSKGTKHTIEII
ncbi:MAG: hypothetical protein QXI48_07730 [Candidatus Bathyarchaeia archaeon]